MRVLREFDVMAFVCRKIRIWQMREISERFCKPDQNTGSSAGQRFRQAMSCIGEGGPGFQGEDLLFQQ